jgi:hypothetical protein
MYITFHLPKTYVSMVLIIIVIKKLSQNLACGIE